MADEEFDLEELSRILEGEEQLLAELDVDNLTEEKKKVLERVVEMYLTDRGEFEEFITESGLRELLADLDNVEVKDISKDRNLEDLKEEVEDKAAENEIDLDLNI